MADHKRDAVKVVLDLLEMAKKNRVGWTSRRQTDLRACDGLLVWLQSFETPQELADALYDLLWGADPTPGSGRVDEVARWSVTLRWGLGAYQPVSGTGLQQLLGLERTQRNARQNRGVDLLVDALVEAGAVLEPADVDDDEPTLPRCLEPPDVGTPDDLLSVEPDMAEWHRVAALAQSLLLPGQERLAAATTAVVNRLHETADANVALSDMLRAPRGRSRRGTWNDDELWAAASLEAMLGRPTGEILERHRGVPSPDRSVVGRTRYFLITSGVASTRGYAPADVEELTFHVDALANQADPRRVARLALRTVNSAMQLLERMPDDPVARRVANDAALVLLENQTTLEDARAYQTFRFLGQNGAFRDDVEVLSRAVSRLAYVDTNHGNYRAANQRLLTAQQAVVAGALGETERATLTYQLGMMLSGQGLRAARSLGFGDARDLLAMTAEDVRTRTMQFAGTVDASGVYLAGGTRRQAELAFERIATAFRVKVNPYETAAREVTVIREHLATMPEQDVDGLPGPWRCQWNLFVAQVALVAGDKSEFVRRFEAASRDFATGAVREDPTEVVLEQFSDGQASQRLLLCGVLGSHLFGLSPLALGIDIDNPSPTLSGALNPPPTAPFKRLQAARFIARALNAPSDLIYTQVLDTFFALR